MQTKGGNPAKEQKVITTKSGEYLQSYEDIVAFMPADPNSKVKVGRNYDYSSTTIYYVGKFLGINLPSIRKGIEQGTIEYNENLDIE
jgi:hypothetical protein